MVTMPTETAQALLNYLAARPYHEVFQLIAAIQSAQPVAQLESEASVDGA